MLQQAMNTCRFFEQEDRAAYALTTANTIVVMSLEEARIIRDYNTILNVRSPYLLIFSSK